MASSGVIVAGGMSGIGLARIARAATNGNLTGTVVEVDGGMRLAPLG
jgi:hypothetical protein